MANISDIHLVVNEVFPDWDSLSRHKSVE
ncbi:hypothetical protein EYZ11_002712 [Aspergillus tanneri]|uniref:Uncharacterized protein n=1 Tax=Aspergillus tanneri TaxID=1220188 RepID=A0A4S3JQ50_9EURO|nr:hypothetical protein EYZ11_002712 [Aspergillus tanneri]